ncbi:MAG: DUF5107 domain-containing protein [Candidatus Dormibacteraeota bacterium]|nr:DUF5107 domain-containing protein [Candidatus Dormibacteraeota bacterium]
MTAAVDDRWTYHGLQVIRIENRALVLDVLPQLGGKVLHLVDKLADRNVLWRNPRVPPHRIPLQANADDHYSGGWDDAFPTGAPSVNRYGDELPYLGEVVSLELRYSLVETGPNLVRVILDGQTPITPARWTRTITIQRDEPVVQLDTRIENVGHLPFDFNWGSHASATVAPGFRIDVPATTTRVDDAGDGSIGRVGDRFDYPVLHREAGGAVDVRSVKGPEVGSYALYIHERLRDGWVAVTDPARRRGFGIVFDHEVHRAVWQWTVFGGFRGWYHVIVEPWIAGPPALRDAVEDAVALSLAPGEVFTATMAGVLYSGVTGVAHLARDGSVTEDRG